MQQDEGRYVCRATNELGEDQTEANLVCRPLPHLQSVDAGENILSNNTCFRSVDSSCRHSRTRRSPRSCPC